MRYRAIVAAFFAGIFLSSCAQDGQSDQPEKAVPASILNYANSLQYYTTMRGNELRFELLPSENVHRADVIEYDTYKLHVQGICSCVFAESQCNWSGEPIRKIIFMDADFVHGYSFSGGEAECRAIGKLSADEADSYIKAKTTRI